MFCDTVAGAQASANLYSLIETCKANRIDPYSYLVELFRLLPQVKTVEDFDALLPCNRASVRCPLIRFRFQFGGVES